MNSVSLKDLRRRLRSRAPDNEDRVRGYALVNVLPSERFLAGHIPGSINIPLGQEKEFEKYFDRSKEIILYGASDHCPAARQMARALISMGYRSVREFDGGMAAWRENSTRDSSSLVEFGRAMVFEMSIA